ncbi:DEAD/DEAH box helicase [Hymenobacter sp. 5516J-16]|uniref:DEAD/DEAH box helicase n=1 Tax=Hymenobacter sp. 5516J-16 TaxID=2932253 RepID=UPI001FD17977|nr:DEAD/DEAH box helicase [Hymenobacter sp. 5516J-16]UOQ76542.1 DEAD/DEAH box helicase [Hymenobacter sp. 5516J-16]
MLARSPRGGAPQAISSTFFPTVDVPGVSNQLRLPPDASPARYQDLREVLMLRTLSHWGAEQYPAPRLVALLTAFLDEYERWTTQQRLDATRHPADESCYTPLLQAQGQALARMRHAVTLLESNEAVREAFRRANTAMLMQMIVSDDPAYAGETKSHADFAARFAATSYTDLEAFRQHPGRRKREGGGHEPFSYRPFQLAFLLLSLNSVTVNEVREPAESEQKSLSDRELVDLIWFPTGGGKTEAYLAVTALSIIWRRWHGGPRGQQGVAVLMRYTLRLLTTQQSERASRLLCALEFLRTHWRNDAGQRVLGREPLTLGLWVGQATTPNTRAEAGQAYQELLQEVQLANHLPAGTPRKFYKNVFQLAACPWCGCESISRVDGLYQTGFDARGQLTCLNRRCHFGQRDAADQGSCPVPVHVVDEELYATPPTLLFATVDKFAMLPHKEQAGRFFSQNGVAPPGLIIQDELHLLSGPLGSLTGLFERLVLALCTDRLGQRPPKIIASTATTRNTSAQVRALYDRSVAVFPPAGIRYDDSFFAYNTPASQRRHVGVMATGKTNLDMQLQLTSLLLLARSEAWRALRPASPTEDAALTALDPYWTLVLYYNSLRDVGKMYNKISSEVFGLVQAGHQHRGLEGPGRQWLYYGLMSRTRELTSRVESNKIKDALHELGEPLKLNDAPGDQRRVAAGVDLVLASNMLSVGIDISRLNLMVLCGQPRNSAEYIQASSRVARNTTGVVFSLLDANRTREKSIFEQYTSFNQAYYKFVEPLSLTPFTPQTLDRMLNSLLVTWVRHHKGKEATGFTWEMATELTELLTASLDADPALAANLEQRAAILAHDWLDRLQAAHAIGKPLKYKGKKHNTPLLTKEPGSAAQPNFWNLPTSMRDVDTETTLGILAPVPAVAPPVMPTL